MTCCPHCKSAQDVFAQKVARKELRRYRRKGPRRTTRLLLDLLDADGTVGRTLLDVGGGIGAIQHELLARGFAGAVHVDASVAYLEASRAEALRRGTGDRVRYRYGDVVELAPDLPAADVVTLDRVVCCYPDLQRMIDATAPKATRLFGLVYPRERWEARLGIAAGNAWLRMRGSAFRGYLHPEPAIDAAIRRHGLRRRGAAGTYLWQVVTYARDHRA